MGMQYDGPSDHVFERRRESVIFYDGHWYTELDNSDRHLFASRGPEQSIEMSKEYLSGILAYFDSTDNRKEFGLIDLVTKYHSELGL